MQFLFVGVFLSTMLLLLKWHIVEILVGSKVLLHHHLGKSMKMNNFLDKKQQEDRTSC